MAVPRGSDHCERGLSSRILVGNGLTTWLGRPTKGKRYTVGLLDSKHETGASIALASKRGVRSTQSRVRTRRKSYHACYHGTEYQPNIYNDIMLCSSCVTSSQQRPCPRCVSLQHEYHVHVAAEPGPHPFTASEDTALVTSFPALTSSCHFVKASRRLRVSSVFKSSFQRSSWLNCPQCVAQL